MLPSSWVDELFRRLSVRYGAAFARQYGDLDIADVKADWAHVLAGFDRCPSAINYGLENVGDLPPNATQFRAIARRGWVDAAAALPAPPADQRRIDAAVAAMNSPKPAPRGRPAQECIDNIEARCNGKPSRAQRHMVAHCLRMPGTHTALPGFAQPEQVEVAA